jgi:hypothetical protein
MIVHNGAPIELIWFDKPTRGAQVPVEMRSRTSAE